MAARRGGGHGVSRAVAGVCGEIAHRLGGFDACDQAGLDEALRTLDGTAALARLGANAVLAVSLAAARAAAAAQGEALHRWIAHLAGTTPTLPMPMVNILSGGVHAGRGMDVRDFLAVPVGAGSFGEALDWSCRGACCRGRPVRGARPADAACRRRRAGARLRDG